MSLIKCSECGKEVSEKASSCPGCGNPISRTTQRVEVSTLSPEQASASNRLSRFAIRVRLILGYICLIFVSGILTIYSPIFGMVVFVVATALLVYLWRQYTKIYKV